MVQGGLTPFILPAQIPSNFDSDSVQVELFDQLGSLLTPVGSKSNPATSCMDIYNCNGADFKPGECCLSLYKAKYRYRFIRQWMCNLLTVEEGGCDLAYLVCFRQLLD